MSEQFEELRSRLGGLDDDVADLKGDVANLKGDVAELKGDVADLKGDVAELKGDVAELKGDVAELKTDVRDLRRHMGVLHEEVLDRFKALGENDGLRQEMRDGFAQMRQMFLDHTIPGDAADRHFASTLNNHEQRIQALEQRK